MLLIITERWSSAQFWHQPRARTSPAAIHPFINWRASYRRGTNYRVVLRQREEEKIFS
jgi:hypothetical protein